MLICASRAQLRLRRWLPLLVMLWTSIVASQVDLGQLLNRAESRYGDEAAATVSQWQAMLDAIAPLNEQQKLARVNQFFNSRVRWVDDRQAWQAEDYWATPLETMARGVGDCEDYAIAKYMTLILAGVEVDKLRITYVKARLASPASSASQPHMVLAYYASPGAIPKILDNIRKDITSADERADLTPVFGFNSNGLWVGRGSHPVARDPAARMSRWRDVLRRALDEGMG